MSYVTHSTKVPLSSLTREQAKELALKIEDKTWAELEQKDTLHVRLHEEVRDVVFKCMDSSTAAAYAEAFPFPGVACRIVDAKTEGWRRLKNVQAFFGKALGTAFEVPSELTLIDGQFSVDLGVFEVSVKHARLDNLITIARTLKEMDEKGIEDLEAEIQRELDSDKIKQYETELAIAKFFSQNKDIMKQSLVIAKFFSQNKDITKRRFPGEQIRSIEIGRSVTIWAKSGEASLEDVPLMREIAATILNEEIESRVIREIIEFMLKQEEPSPADICEIALTIPCEFVQSVATELIIDFMVERKGASFEDIPLMRKIAATIPDEEIRSRVIQEIIEFMLKQEGPSPRDMHKMALTIPDKLIQSEVIQKIIDFMLKQEEPSPEDIYEIALTIPCEFLQSYAIEQIVDFMVERKRTSFEDIPLMRKIAATTSDEEMRSKLIQEIIEFMLKQKEASLEDVPLMREIASEVDECLRPQLIEEIDEFEKQFADQS